MTKEDLELIDALVLVGAISRPAARELAASDIPDGRVATRIMEMGLCNLAGGGCVIAGGGCVIVGGGCVIVDRLAKAERSEDDLRKMHRGCECGAADRDGRKPWEDPPEAEVLVRGAPGCECAADLVPWSGDVATCLKCGQGYVRSQSATTAAVAPPRIDEQKPEAG